MRIQFVWCFVFFVISFSIKGQMASNTRSKQILIVSSADSILVDTLPIIKGSFMLSIQSTLLFEGIDYEMNYTLGILRPINIPNNSQIVLSYKVIEYPFNKQIFHKNRKLIQPEYRENRNPFLYTKEKEGIALFSNDGLKMNGSLSRGLAFGNNQDVVINSNLNLQLAGKLNNDIEVLAAISDENNPIQPEGNTQQLQDFDRVFIQLSKDATKLTVGDFEMTRPNGSYFMNYNKKSRGLQFSSVIGLNSNSRLLIGGEGALSRGRFARNSINGIEGNLGPYRLSGVNGELYIIIISGTEAVYLDGEKMKRGEQNDYVIDYNTGEIIFMPRRVITQYSRIIVEFQYSDRNYARSVFHLNSEYQTENYSIRANYFSEQDSKNQPFLQELTDSNKAILASVGDNLNNALAPAEVATKEFTNTKLLYRKVDTLGYAAVFVLANNSLQDSIFYEVRFSLVGQGNGDYVQAQSGANGRVFKWVEPINGIRQGNYAPLILLISPKSLQMVTVGADVIALKNTKVSVEFAQSNYDKNLYATIDKQNDIGYGFKTGIVNTIKLQQRKENYWYVQSEVQYEYVDEKFRNVERYRNVEFDRIWNRQLTNQQNLDTGFDEHIVSFRSAIQKSSLGSVYYQFGFYDRSANFNGSQHLIGTNLTVGKNRLLAETELINTVNTAALQTLSNEVTRYKIDYARQIAFLTTGVRVENEQSNFKRNTDSLQLGSFSFNQFTLYANNTDSANIKYGISLVQREDFQPQASEFRSATLARSINGNIEYTQKNFNRLAANFTYREFEVRDTNFTNLQPEQTILSRIEYDYGFIKRVFTANTYYQLGSGQELRRDFQYIEVAAGQGVYVWRDFNKDGLQQLNEFQLASFADKNQANFIRVFLPSNTTIRTNSNQFNQTLNINPNIIWNNKLGFKKLIARFNNQTALRVDRKTSQLDALSFINPFQIAILDTALISVASLLRNTLFFNRSSPAFGADIFYQENQSKNFLTNGFDSRLRQEQGTNLRWNLTTSWGVTFGYTYGYRIFNSDFFTVNNYNYTFNEAKPRLIYQATQKLRATFVFSYFEAINAAEFGNQKGTNREIGSEVRYTAAKQGAINIKYSLYQIAFNGDISSPLGYDMLQGLSAGNNQIWNINYQQRLGNNIQININYDGRKPDGLPIIHVGRMEARYLF